jgi:prephenate dehydrogenase
LLPDDSERTTATRSTDRITARSGIGHRRDNRGMRIAILGLGLIGGSIARAVRADAGGHDPGASSQLAAWTPSGDGPAAARAAGVIDEAADTLEAAVAGADLVILAAPPVACLALLEELGRSRDRLARNAVITDVASTKVTIGRTADRLGLPFVGGHPMAGREATGFGSSSADLFRGRPWVVVSSATSPVTSVGTERVDDLARACGARPVRLDAETHDRVVAGISHLPLVLSTALVETVVGPVGGPDRTDWAIARELASTGWAGMTRLAQGSPEMGADIARTNAPAIAARLRDLRAEIDAWIELLEGDPGSAALEARFRAARDRLTRADGGAG